MEGGVDSPQSDFLAGLLFAGSEVGFLNDLLDVFLQSMVVGLTLWIYFSGESLSVEIFPTAMAEVVESMVYEIGNALRRNIA